MPRCKVADVVTRYAAQHPNRDGEVHWWSESGGSAWYGTPRSQPGVTLRARGRTLTTYRETLAVYLGDGTARAPGERRAKHRRLFLKNGDRFSPDSDHHLSLAQAHCCGPTASFGALRAAGVRVEALTLEHLLDWQPDGQTPVVRDPAGRFWHSRWQARPDPMVPQEFSLMRPGYVSTGVRFHPPKVGMFMAYFGADHAALEGWTAGSWHVLGGVLVRWLPQTWDAEGRVVALPPQVFLCAMDESAYFCSELGKPGRNLAQAYARLKPAAVVRAEQLGWPVKRQGEWFCVATGMEDADVARQLGLPVTKFRQGQTGQNGRSFLNKRGELPVQDRNANRHGAWTVRVDHRILVSRRLMHRTPQGKATGEHAALELGCQWWEAHKNTEVRSYTLPRNAAGWARYD
jgi:hypothetical protein